MARPAPDRRIVAGGTIVSGLIAGLIGAAIMAMYAMILGSNLSQVRVLHTHVPHRIGRCQPETDDDLDEKQAMQGNDFFFQAGPAMLGLAVHMMVGAAFGLLFAPIARGLRLRGAAAILASVAYGLLVMVVMSFVGLPVVAGVFGGGKPIADMPTMVGWTTFAIEHGLFGLVLGLWFARGVGEPAAETLRYERIREETV